MQLNEAEIKTAKEFFAKFNVTQGFSQEQQAALMRHLLIESLGLELDDQQKKDMYRIIYSLGNASAARQKFEKAGILKASETKSRGKDAGEVADKYAC